MIKKFILFLCLFLCFFTLSTFASTTLYQNITKTIISSGVVLKNYSRFTDNGWLNINVLEVDLSDKYTSIGLLTSSNGAGTVQNLRTMANNAGSIAAINGDFFASTSGKGHAIGLSVSEGKVITSSYADNASKNIYATLGFDNNLIPFLDFFTDKVTITSSKTKESIIINNINKYSTNYEVPTLYTPAWGTYSHGAKEDLPLTEMVVSDGKVVEIRYNEEASLIPEDGYVISTIGVGADFINNNFSIGTKVSLDIELIPNVQNINFAISGGAALIQNGNIPSSFSSNITGLQPRTAVGVSKDGETMYLVTVDGRQNASIGMTQFELAEFMLELESYNAINLDGGGSTTMVARRLGENITSLINIPSDGSIRSVINGIGVFSNAPKSNVIKNLIIEVADTNVFIEKKRDVTVKAYDKYYNPIDIDKNDVIWTYTGVPISVIDGIISGDTVGMTMLKATVGKVSKEIEINILSAPNELSISPKRSTVLSNDKVIFSVSAKNKNGYYGLLNSDDVIWKIEQGNGVMEGNIFTASDSGDYIISASSGNAKSYALITVSGKVATVVDNFEDVNYIFDPYPDEVEGNAIRSNEKSHSGNYSAKLSYNFNKNIQIRAAYIEFKNNGIDIPVETADLSFWLYNEGKKDDIIKIKLKDSNGRVHLVIIQKGITHTGWKEFTYSLKDISLPAKITDIYLAQDNIDIKSSGHVYIDDLTFYKNSSVYNSNVVLPQDIKGTDEFQKQSELLYDDSYRIAIYDDIAETVLMLDNLKYKKLADIFNANAKVAILTNQANNTFLNSLNIKMISEKGYSQTTYKNSLFINIDSNNGGIRKTNSAQWINFQEDIQKSKSDNIFIVLNSSLDNFNDSKEARLFIDVLCDLRRETSKNIWVIHKGSYTDYTMERGIKYLGINNSTIKSDDCNDVAKNTKYIMITVNRKDLSYEIKRLFE